MALQVGDKLGPYEILSPIGVGGMGDVYKARDTRLERLVAIETSKTEFSSVELGCWFRRTGSRSGCSVQHLRQTARLVRNYASVWS